MIYVKSQSVFSLYLVCNLFKVKEIKKIGNKQKEVKRKKKKSPRKT